MGSTTAKGTPFPTGTDRVMDGDNAMQAMAEFLDFTTAQRMPGSTSAAAGLTAYPDGFSTITLVTADAVAGGWPEGVSGHVWTLRQGSDRAAQFWFRNSAATPDIRYRSLTSSTGNSVWVQLATPVTAGTATVDVAASATGSVTVTFPAGRFTVAPVVVCSAGFTTQYFSSPGTTSATSTVLSIRHYKDTVATQSITVKWMARVDA